MRSSQHDGSQPPTLSIIVPAFNEEAAIVHTIEAIVAEVERTGETFELVVVDDGSRDATPDLLDRAASEDPRVRPVQLSRNFGKESALAAGLGAARGEALLFLDADLQHPPSLIPDMVARWRAGYDVVSATKESRGRESLAYKLMAKLFNLLMGGAAGNSFQGASDFKLLDRQVVDAIQSCPERGRFFRGLVTWVGFRTTTIPFQVADRVAGETKWSLTSLVRYSLQNLIAFSAFPLHLVAMAGFATLVFAVGLSAQTLYRYLVGDALSGFTTVILVQLVLGGVLLGGLGVIALYVAELYREVKARPVFVVRRPRESRSAETVVDDTQGGD